MHYKSEHQQIYCYSIITPIERLLVGVLSASNAIHRKTFYFLIIWQLIWDYGQCIKSKTNSFSSQWSDIFKEYSNFLGSSTIIAIAIGQNYFFCHILSIFLQIFCQSIRLHHWFSRIYFFSGLKSIKIKFIFFRHCFCMGIKKPEIVLMTRLNEIFR